MEAFDAWVVVDRVGDIVPFTLTHIEDGAKSWCDQLNNSREKRPRAKPPFRVQPVTVTQKESK